MTPLLEWLIVAVVIMLPFVWVASKLPTNEELARAIAGPFEPNPIYRDAPRGETEVAHETMVSVLADYWCIPEEELIHRGLHWREGYCEYCGRGTGAWACTHFEDHLKERVREALRRHGEPFCASCGQHIERSTYVEEVVETEDSPPVFTEDAGMEPMTFETTTRQTWEPCHCRFEHEDGPQLFHFPVVEGHQHTPEERLAKVDRDPFDSWEATRHPEARL